jgi:Fe2+ transport system protein FeoA
MSDQDLLPLQRAQSGQRVELVEIRGESPSALRLAEMGLNPHTRIRVLRSAAGQPLIICVRGTHLALDRKTAECLYVRPLPDEPGRAGHRRRRRGWRLRGRRGADAGSKDEG